MEYEWQNDSMGYLRTIPKNHGTGKSKMVKHGFFLTEVIDLVCVTYHDLSATSLELIGFGELSQYFLF